MPERAKHRAFSLRRADWQADREALRHVRETVFVQEQRVPLEMEWDEADARALHVIAVDPHGNPVGTGRLTEDGRIGRMAVLKDWRGTGVGAAMLEFLMAAARKRGLEEVALNAQTSAIGFYRRYGYTEEGETFMEAGIPHVRMRANLGDHDG